MEIEANPSWEDYHILATTGEGAYGTVFAARCK